MLVADTKGEATRYRMLETIREFAVRELGDIVADIERLAVFPEYRRPHLIASSASDSAPLRRSN